MNSIASMNGKMDAQPRYLAALAIGDLVEPCLYIARHDGVVRNAEAGENGIIDNTTVVIVERDKDTLGLHRLQHGVERFGCLVCGDVAERVRLALLTLFFLPALLVLVLAQPLGFDALLFEALSAQPLELGRRFSSAAFEQLEYLLEITVGGIAVPRILLLRQVDPAIGGTAHAADRQADLARDRCLRCKAG